MSGKNFGTREWAEKNINCCTGCIHNCLYCYARHMAVRFKQRAYHEWEKTEVRQKDVEKSHPKYDGTVMFPSSHDITPENLDACLIVLFGEYRDNIIFSSTITATDNEPSVPSWDCSCLFINYDRGEYI